MRVWAVVLFILAFQLASPPSPAKAGGVEYAGAGTQALGRGGAVAARADDPMVLMYNPAGLVELRGMQLMINANLALMNACVDPIGYYGWGSYAGGKPAHFVDPETGVDTTLQLGRFGEIGPAEQAYYNGRYDTVCMDQHLTPVPEVGLTVRVSEGFGFGLGMMFPAVTPHGRWGGETGMIRSADGTLRPTPTRYMMMNSGTTGMFPTFGLAFRLAKWLRFGASFQWGVINIDNTTMASLQGGTTPSDDVRAHVTAVDWFIPSLTVSMHVVPTDAIDLVVGFKYQGDLDAAGEIASTTGFFTPTSVPRTTTNEVTHLRQHFPWALWGALRYADRLAPRPTGAGKHELNVTETSRLRDAFQDERFDVELDVRYEMNARHRDLTLEFVPGNQIDFEGLDGAISSIEFPDLTVPKNVIDKRWQDQLSVRVGGTYNLLPGLFGLSWGAHYENRGVDPDYMQIDYWPVQRIGLHAGVRVRIARSIDLMFSYAHIFQETLVVGAPPHANATDIYTEYAATNTVEAIDKRVGVLESSDMPLVPLEEQRPASIDGTAKLAQNIGKKVTGQPPYITNAGTYRSGIDVVSAGITMHF